MIQRFPDPQLLAFLLEVVPHLIQLQDDGFSCGFWLLLVRLGKGSDPVQYGLRRDAEEKRDAVHRDTTEGEPHGVDLGVEGLASRGGTGQLVATLLTLLFGLASGGAMLDDPITLAFGAFVPLCSLQRELPYRPLEEYR